MKKNWNVAKVFTLLITVLFLASTLFVGCKNQEPTPEPEPTKYMVTYVTNPEGLQVENFPTMGEVEENKTIELPTLTLEGYTFDGWYDGDTKVESPYKVTKTVTLTAKFTENVAPSLPEDGEEGGTTPPADGEEGGTTPPADGEEGGTTPPAGGEEDGTTPPADGEEGGTTPPADGEEGGSTPPAGGEEGGTTPPAGGEEGGTTPPAGEGGEGGVIPDPDPVVPEPVVTFSVTYTVEGIDSALVTDLPKSGDVNKDTVLTLSPLTAPAGYVFDGWFINDEGVEQHTVVADVTIVAKFSVVPQVDPDPTGTTYTITNVKSSWVGDNDVVVYAYLPALSEEDVQKDYLFSASYEDDVVTFTTDKDFSTAILITIPAGTSIDGLSPTYSETEPDIWEVKIAQTDNLNFTDVTTFALPDSYSITFYVKIPDWTPAITPVKIAIDGNGYSWDEFEMVSCENSWYKYEATNITDLNSNTTYQLRLVQGNDTKYQKASNEGGDPYVLAPNGFVVIDLTESIEWVGSDFYTTAITTPETVPELN